MRRSSFYLQRHQSVENIKMVGCAQHDDVFWIVAAAIGAADDVVHVKVSAAVASRHLATEAISPEDGIIAGYFMVKALGEEIILQEGDEKSLSQSWISWG